MVLIAATQKSGSNKNLHLDFCKLKPSVYALCLWNEGPESVSARHLMLGGTVAFEFYSKDGRPLRSKFREGWDYIERSMSPPLLLDISLSIRFPRTEVSEMQTVPPGADTVNAVYRGDVERNLDNGKKRVRSRITVRSNRITWP